MPARRKFSFIDEWKKTVVLFETRTRESSEENYLPVGTATIVNYRRTSFLVTCRHVVEGNAGNLLAAVNDAQGKTMRTEIDVDWSYHPKNSVDLVACHVDDWAEADIRGLPLTKEYCEDYTLLEDGQDIFFLGFPVYRWHAQKTDPIMRAGIISSKLDDDEILIEGNVFPGNSGSPVFLKDMTIGKKWLRPKLIGIVSSYIPYRDSAISQQTGNVRVIFEENMALGRVYAVKYIKETVAAAK